MTIKLFNITRDRFAVRGARLVLTANGQRFDICRIYRVQRLNNLELLVTNGIERFVFDWVWLGKSASPFASLIKTRITRCPISRAQKFLIRQRLRSLILSPTLFGGPFYWAMIKEPDVTLITERYGRLDQPHLHQLPLQRAR